MAPKEKQRVTLFMHPAIIKHARANALIEDMSLAALVEKALIAYLPEEIVLKKIKSILPQ